MNANGTESICYDNIMYISVYVLKYAQYCMRLDLIVCLCMCIKECPSGQVFSDCSGSCPYTCEDLWPQTQCLPGPCSPGCTCPSGQVGKSVFVCLHVCVCMCLCGWIADLILKPHCVSYRCYIEAHVCSMLAVLVQHSPSQTVTATGLWARQRSQELCCHLAQSFSTCATHGNTLITVFVRFFFD